MGRVVVTGNFDGCHLGHAALVEKVRLVAGEQGLEPLAITFNPHTRHVLTGDTIPLILTDSREKQQIFADWEIPLAEVEFTPELSKLGFADYVRTILVERFSAKAWVLGYDHSFGRGGLGHFAGAQEKFPQLTLHQVPPFLVKDMPVSSSRIRTALQAGDLQEANDLLGRPFVLAGMVVHGEGRGKNLGFPTANLQLFDKAKLVPASGVYAGQATIEPDGGKFLAVANLGNKPTFGSFRTGIEIHLLDFHGELYGKNLQMKLNLRLRDEIKFKQVSDLVQQIASDAASVRQLLSGRNL